MLSGPQRFPTPRARWRQPQGFGGGVEMARGNTDDDGAGFGRVNMTGTVMAVATTANPTKMANPTFQRILLLGKNTQNH